MDVPHLPQGQNQMGFSASHVSTKKSLGLVLCLYIFRAVHPMPGLQMLALSIRYKNYMFVMHIFSSRLRKRHSSHLGNRNSSQPWPLQSIWCSMLIEYQHNSEIAVQERWSQAVQGLLPHFARWCHSRTSPERLPAVLVRLLGFSCSRWFWVQKEWGMVGPTPDHNIFPCQYSERVAANLLLLTPCTKRASISSIVRICAEATFIRARHQGFQLLIDHPEMTLHRYK